MRMKRLQRQSYMMHCWPSRHGVRPKESRGPFQPSHLYSLANPSQDRIPYPPYDNPPPAYADDGSLSSNAPVSLVDRERPYEDKHLVESEGFESPFQSHNTLPSHLQAGPSTGSPLPMHSPLPGSIAQPSMPLSYQTNYQQLFRHVSMRQQGASQRPYNEFQQQFAGPGGPGLGYRQRIDAGGFRIPPPLEPVLSAEEEKQQLSERYAAEEEAYQRKQMEDMELIDKQPPKVPDHHQDSSPESDDIEPKRPDSDAIEPKSPKSDDDIEPKSPVSSDQTTDGLTESPKEPENETIIHKPHQDD
ncbi:hypothetical protein CLU79DRAFT_377898 [Phycomyces nitens]|nr:hypothetical protein CLU79DRAFT_377898 [Phycomyces nitens]